MTWVVNLVNFLREKAYERSGQVRVFGQEAPARTQRSMQMMAEVDLRLDGYYLKVIGADLMRLEKPLQMVVESALEMYDFPRSVVDRQSRKQKLDDDIVAAENSPQALGRS